MSRTIFLESVAGVSGDMFAASFVDAGLIDRTKLVALPACLGWTEVDVELKAVTKATMHATHLEVRVRSNAWRQTIGHEHTDGTHLAHGALRLQPTESDPGDIDTHLIMDPETHWHVHHRDIDRFLEGSTLANPVKELARRIFRLLAESEAEAHGMRIEDVAFHEIGTADSILDVVMAAFCVHEAGAVRWLATPIRPGRGVVNMAHGTHPVPPPASARLLVGLPITGTPDAITRANIELSTPTGIAILKALAPKFVAEMPTGTVRAHGMGAGLMDLGTYPNVFRVTLLDDAPASMPASLPYEQDRVVEIACNIDDDTGERIAWIAESLLKEGALDVWLTSATGKKGRPLVCLFLLAPEERSAPLVDWLLRQSSTFGVRYQTWHRWKLARHFEERQTTRGPIRYKVGLTTTGEVLKEKPEFDQLRRIWDAPHEPHL